VKNEKTEPGKLQGAWAAVATVWLTAVLLMFFVIRVLGSHSLEQLRAR
jgi:hypothetical protein